MTRKFLGSLRAWFGMSPTGVQGASNGGGRHREGRRGGIRRRDRSASVGLVLVIVLAGWSLARAERLEPVKALEPVTPQRTESTLDPLWLYGIRAVAMTLALLGGLILLHIHRLNRRLRCEVQERKTAEAKFRGL